MTALGEFLEGKGVDHKKLFSQKKKYYFFEFTDCGSENI